VCFEADEQPYYVPEQVANRLCSQSFEMKIHLVRLMEEILPPDQSPLPIWHKLADLSYKNDSFTEIPDDADRIIFIDLHQVQHVDVRKFISKHRLYRDHKNKILVWNERDRPLFDVRGLYVNVPKQLKNEVTSIPIPYLFVPADSLFYGTNFTTHSRTRRCTYRGTNTHKCRRVLSKLHIPDCSLIDSTLSNSIPTHEFLAELDNSVHALCPRGHGLTSFRLYEVMARGCLPVIIADGWVPPRGISWQSFCTVVQEKDTSKFAEKLDYTIKDVTRRQATLANEFNTLLAPNVRMNYFIDQISDIPFGDCLSLSTIAKHYNLNLKVREKIMRIVLSVTNR
jgi:hypothetical protein